MNVDEAPEEEAAEEGLRSKQVQECSCAPQRHFSGTKNNMVVTVRNFERDMNALGQKCGITGVRFSPYTLRPSFAVNYLRDGGNLEYVRRTLGHASLSTTQKYSRSLGVEAIQKFITCTARFWLRAWLMD